MDDQKIHIGSRAHQSMVCAQCGGQVAPGEQYTYKGKDGSDVYLCAACREKVNQTAREETRNPRLIGAFGGGILAALIAGSLWYGIVILTNYEIGYIAIGVGYLVGKGVHIGSGRKRGIVLQAISAMLTLVTFFIAEFFVTAHALKGVLLQSTNPDVQAAILEPGFSIFRFMIENPDIYLKSIVSPMGLLIWAIGLYVAYTVNKPHKI